MTRNEFDALVRLIQSIAYHETGRAIHQERAGSIEEEIELAAQYVVDDFEDE